MSEFVIREAVAADIPTVLMLIREMATYERAADRFRVDESRLRRYIFCDRPIATIFLAEEDDEPVGYAIVLPAFSSYAGIPDLYLEDLFLRDTVRGKGYGKRMMAHLARYVKQRGFRNLAWSVLDWNTPSIDFYDRLHATRESDRFHYTLEGEALERLAQVD